MYSNTPSPCGIDQPHCLHKATLHEATLHIRKVLCRFPWLKRKAASILQQAEYYLPQPSLHNPRAYSETWYAAQLLRAYMHKHSTPAVCQQIEQLYEVML